jgi:cytoskeleton protein RodZ
MMDEVEGAAFEGADHMPKTAGQRLREAREAAAMSLEDVATATRIPTRHLESLENSEFSKLPAPTYSIGFAKSYAAAVGLDRAEIGEQLRAELGDTRPATFTADGFEPGDPARAMPKWLILAALVAVVLAVAAFSWLQSRELAPTDVPTVAEEVAPPEANAPPLAAAPATDATVAVTATDTVWVQVYEDGGKTLFQDEMAAGERYIVPGDAAAPLLRTGKPQALRITVGQQVAPPVGAADSTVSRVSLKGADLLGTAAPAGAPPAAQ